MMRLLALVSFGFASCTTIPDVGDPDMPADSAGAAGGALGEGGGTLSTGPYSGACETQPADHVYSAYGSGAFLIPTSTKAAYLNELNVLTPLASGELVLLEIAAIGNATDLTGVELSLANQDLLHCALCVVASRDCSAAGSCSTKNAYVPVRGKGWLTRMSAERDDAFSGELQQVEFARVSIGSDLVVVESPEKEDCFYIDDFRFGVQTSLVQTCSFADCSAPQNCSQMQCNLAKTASVRTP